MKLQLSPIHEIRFDIDKSVVPKPMDVVDVHCKLSPTCGFSEGSTTYQIDTLWRINVFNGDKEFIGITYQMGLYMLEKTNLDVDRIDLLKVLRDCYINIEMEMQQKLNGIIKHNKFPKMDYDKVVDAILNDMKEIGFYS